MVCHSFTWVAAKEVLSESSSIVGRQGAGLLLRKWFSWSDSCTGVNGCPWRVLRPVEEFLFGSDWGLSEANKGISLSKAWKGGAGALPWKGNCGEKPLDSELGQFSNLEATFGGMLLSWKVFDGSPKTSVFGTIFGFTKWLGVPFPWEDPWEWTLSPELLLVSVEESFFRFRLFASGAFDTSIRRKRWKAFIVALTLFCIATPLELRTPGVIRGVELFWLSPCIHTLADRSSMVNRLLGSTVRSPSERKEKKRERMIHATVCNIRRTG